MPPHPGPVAAADLIGASVGLVLFGGLVIAVVSWYSGVYQFSRFIGKRIDIPVPNILSGPDATGAADDEAGPSGGAPAGGATSTRTVTRTETETDASGPTDLPAFRTVLGILLLPLVLIGINTGISTLATGGVLDAEQPLTAGLVLVGQTPVALLVTLLVAIVVLGRRQGRGWGDVETLLDSSLGPICAIILITGAGGMFGGVLRASGIGAALAESLESVGP